MTSETCTITLEVKLDQDPATWQMSAYCILYIKIEPQSGQNYTVSYDDLVDHGGGIHYKYGPYSSDSPSTWILDRYLIFSGDTGVYKLTLHTVGSDYPFPHDPTVLQINQFAVGSVSGSLGGQWDGSHPGSSGSTYVFNITLADSGGGGGTNEVIEMIEHN